LPFSSKLSGLLKAIFSRAYLVLTQSMESSSEPKVTRASISLLKLYYYRLHPEKLGDPIEYVGNRGYFGRSFESSDW
jgi:hypothetical protein